MATWTLATANTFEWTGNTKTDGTYIYTSDYSENVYQWNPATDAMTLIADSSDFGVQAPVTLIIFKGTLYVRYVTGGGVGFVHRWDGVAHSWTQVFSRAGLSKIFFISNKDTFLIFTDELNGVWHSDDGATWTQGTISVGTSIYNSIATIMDWNASYMYLKFQDSSSTGFVVRWTGTALVSVGDANLTSVEYVLYYHAWVEYSGNPAYTSNFVSYTNDPGPTGLLDYGQNNMINAVGKLTTDIYYFVSGSWVFQGSVPDEPYIAVRLDNGTVYVVLGTGALYSSDEPIIIAVPKDNTFQSFDVEAGGNYLYIGVLNSLDQPQILRFPTALNANADVAYDPADGTRVELQCGRYVEDLVWAIGDFGTQKVVRYSPTNYWYWYSETVSDAWAAPARGLVVGPSDDSLVMFSLDEYLEMKQSYWLADSGPYWVTTNPEVLLPFEVNAITRLDIAPEEVLIGAGVDGDPYWYPYWTTVEYSPASGFQFSDVSGSLANDVGAVTSIIYGVN